MLRITTASALIFMSLSSAWSQDMVYSPINPSFGGNPLNSSHLLGMANAQRTATARDAKTNSPGGGGGSGETPGNTDADLFVRQLQGRLLSALASQVTEAIFGENPQDSGTVQFGDTTVTFERSIDSITLTITDPTGVTVIVVPQLVTGPGPNSLMAQTFSTEGDLTTDLGSQDLGSGGDLTGSDLGGGLNQ